MGLPGGHAAQDVLQENREAGGVGRTGDVVTAYQPRWRTAWGAQGPSVTILPGAPGQLRPDRALTRDSVGSSAPHT